MRLEIIQHVSFESAGTISDWAIEKKHQVHTTRVYANEVLPDPQHFDALILMGGSMSVHDEMNFDWLKPEKELIRSAIHQNKKILGICLGAQLLAEALGGEVFSNPVKEIGFFPVQFKQDPWPFPVLTNEDKHIPCFHWHGESFSLPAGSGLLASSTACPQQSFISGYNFFGIQFHPEMTIGIVKALVSHESWELIPGEFIQDAESILANLGMLEKIKPFFWKTLDNFFDNQ